LKTQQGHILDIVDKVEISQDRMSFFNRDSLYFKRLTLGEIVSLNYRFLSLSNRAPGTIVF